MLKFEKNTTTLVAASTTESLIDKTDFRARLKDLSFHYNGDDTTGDISNSKAIITIDGVGLFNDTFSNLLTYYQGGLGATNYSGIVRIMISQASTKQFGFKLLTIDVPILYSFNLSCYNADSTNTAYVYVGIIYLEP